MIPIKIANKKYTIKSIPELTTKEFVELSTIEDIDTIKYIAWQTGVTIDKAFFAVIDSRVEQEIGIVPDITKMQRPILKYVDYSKTVQTVGQRHQIEISNLSGYKLLVHVLAVSQAQSNNIDEVYKLRDDYMQRSWIQILPAGFFFYQKLRHGNRQERDYLEKLRTLINILLRKNRQAVKG
jgi:hypothetical protein